LNKVAYEEYLVPDRECGECTVCCQYLSIDSPGIVKLPNVPCENLMECGGCNIYENWPDVCNEWFCAWRNMPNLGDEWRPDKMGVLIEFSREDFPEPFSGKVGYRFTILDKQKLSTNKALVLFIGKQISIGVPCLLSYGTDAGVVPSTAFLNFALDKAVKARNGQGIMHGLVKALEACEQMPKVRMKIEKGHLVDVPS